MYARAHAMLQNFDHSTTTTAQRAIYMQLACVVDYADSRYSTTIRPPGPLPLPSQKQSNRNSHQYTILYVLMSGNTLV